VSSYAPVVRWVVRRRGWVVVGALLLLATAVPAFLSLGSEFMPPLNEGTLLYMPTAPPGIAIGEASRILQRMDRELREVPEVERVFGKIGRAETPTDPAPLSMVETVVQLAPREKWRPGLTWDGLVAELDQKLRYPGMPNLWWMPIQTRTEMLATGVRSQLGVKVFGDDLAQVERAAIAQRVRRACHGRVLPRCAHRPRARRPLWRLGRGREQDARDRDRRHDGFADGRRAGALRDPGPLRA
jgi:Cu(I)/Ag(I) efflux system membrane protein CusA/SilA